MIQKLLKLGGHPFSIMTVPPIWTHKWYYKKTAFYRWGDTYSYEYVIFRHKMGHLRKAINISLVYRVAAFILQTKIES